MARSNPAKTEVALEHMVQEVRRAHCARLIALLVAVLTWGCTQKNQARDKLNDSENLDAFSHAYTDFLDAGSTVEIDAGLLTAQYDPLGYWKECRAALVDARSDSSRLSHAKEARDIYDGPLSKAMETYLTDLDEVDKRVLRLVELANTIQNAEYRSDAVEIARSAREIHSDLSRWHDLWEQKLRLGETVLEDVVSKGGRMHGTPFNMHALQEGARVGTEADDIARRSSDAASRMKDSFAALKGKAKIKEYPTKTSKE